MCVRAFLTKLLPNPMFSLALISKSGRILTTFYVASSKARFTFASFKSHHQNIIDELNKLSNGGKGRKYGMIGRW